MDPSSAPLFQPFSYKSLHLPNRVVMAPMTRLQSPGGVSGANMADYYRRRAEGGVGFIITEGVTIDRPAASFDNNIPNIHDPKSVEAWRHLVTAVHAAGAKIAAQLWHVGLSDNPAGDPPPNPDARPEGPSASTERHTSMTDDDIAATIDAFARAAAVAKDCGFDAVEVHGAHGYLLDQFLWEDSNRRTDAYGGGHAGRARFAVEVVRAIRSRVGEDHPILMRLSQWKVGHYAAKIAPTPQSLEAIVGPLSDGGVDIFHMSTRRYWEPEFDGSTLNLAGWTKKLTGRPTITVGSVGLAGAFEGAFDDSFVDSGTVDLSNLYDRLDRDEFDLVAVGRALITNPDWVAKIRDGRSHELQNFYSGAFERLSDAEITEFIRAQRTTNSEAR